ncbi:RICIN domain-containing protein [Streptomyces sp. NPDC099088]|uniref:RICIN domain-containing protein n=1 Tax=Streptomyces sp. NPDC099088 TaxID=3366101 RepID=UPI0037FC4404
MPALRTTRARRAALSGAAVASAVALVTGPMITSAASATFFRTVSDGNGQMLTSSAADSNSPVVFSKGYKERTEFKSAIAGDPKTPEKFKWAQVMITDGLSIVHEKTGKCLDVERRAEPRRGKAIGSKVVLNPCDGTYSQQWIDLGASHVNPHSFKNRWASLILTSDGKGVTLEKSTKGLSVAQKEKRIQSLTLNFVEVS